MLSIGDLPLAEYRNNANLGQCLLASKLRACTAFGVKGLWLQQDVCINRNLLRLLPLKRGKRRKLQFCDRL